MNLTWSSRAWTDYLHRQDHNRKLALKVNVFIEHIRRSPFRGLGKPEPLRGDQTGWWSRRISEEHRLV